MKIIDGKIVLEIKQCGWCDGKGTSPARVRCPKCRGTRRGPRGGRGGCSCLDGTAYSDTLRETCGRCNGAKTEMETITDYATPEMWQGMTFKVIREEKGRFGFNEEYLGVGYVYTCSDYGQAWKNTDESVIADVRKSTGHQACKFAKDDGTLADHIAILVTPNGYKVKAVYGGENPSDNSRADRQVSQMFDRSIWAR